MKAKRVQPVVQPNEAESLVQPAVQPAEGVQPVQPTEFVRPKTVKGMYDSTPSKRMMTDLPFSKQRQAENGLRRVTW